MFVIIKLCGVFKEFLCPNEIGPIILLLVHVHVKITIFLENLTKNIFKIFFHIFQNVCA